MNKKEFRRAYFSSKIETRENTDGAKTIEGYFIVYDKETALWPGCFESIAHGAADASLANNDIRAIFNHNTDIVLGRMSAGTAEFKSDEHGLFGKITVNENDSEAMDIYARVARGDISGCSFGFVPVRESYTVNGTDYHWVIEEADIHEVSVCTFPAYPQTEISARKKDFEEIKTRALVQKKDELKKRLEDIRC